MVERLKKGETVAWNTPQGETSGTVVKRLTRATKLGGHLAEASEAQPQYLVKSAKSGKAAIHKPDALKKA